MNEGDPGAKVGVAVIGKMSTVAGESGAEYPTQTVFDKELDRETTRLIHTDEPQPTTLAEGE